MQQEGFFLENVLIKQFHSFLPEEVEQECFAIASGLRLFEVSEVGAL
jgi:hypothetical protein